MLSHTCRYCGDLHDASEGRYCLKCVRVASRLGGVHAKPSCQRCGGELDDKVFLCQRCISKMEMLNRITPERSNPRRFVIGECEPTTSSGRSRHYMVMGDGENANGLWDNIICAMEECSE
jgi:hypothetical protein